jgi:hypothetical protein
LFVFALFGIVFRRHPVSGTCPLREMFRIASVMGFHESVSLCNSLHGRVKQLDYQDGKIVERHSLPIGTCSQIQL